MIYSNEDVKRMLDYISDRVKIHASPTDPYGESTPVISLPKVIEILDNIRKAL